MNTNTNAQESNANGLKMLIIVGFILLLSGFLFATNPTETQFKVYLKEKIKQESVKEGGGIALIVELFAAPTAWIIGLGTKRDNFYIFSTYTIELEGRKYVYIGIANKFFEL